LDISSNPFLGVDDCNREPVSQEVREQFLEAFISAVELTLREWAGTEVAVRSVYRGSKSKSIGDIVAIVDLQMEKPGTLMLCFPEQTAAGLTRRILTGVMVEFDADMVRDCAGETANVIAGHAKALVANTKHSFTFSTPSVASTAELEWSDQQQRECFTIAFASDLGEFALQLFLSL
jgi:CheY-specific phosphatase CheX